MGLFRMPLILISFFSILMITGITDYCKAQGYKADPRFTKGLKAVESNIFTSMGEILGMKLRPDSQGLWALPDQPPPGVNCYILSAKDYGTSPNFPEFSSVVLAFNRFYGPECASMEEQLRACDRVSPEKSSSPTVVYLNSGSFLIKTEKEVAAVQLLGTYNRDVIPENQRRLGKNVLGGSLTVTHLVNGEPLKRVDGLNWDTRNFSVCTLQFRIDLNYPQTPAQIDQKAKAAIQGLMDFSATFVSLSQKAMTEAGLLDKPAALKEKSDAGTRTAETGSGTGGDTGSGTGADTGSGKISVSDTEMKERALDQKLATLNPDFVPDDRSLSDTSALLNLESALLGTDINVLKQQLQQLEELTTTSGDGSNLKIESITLPPDNSVGPGDKFTLSVKIMNSISDSSRKAASAAARTIGFRVSVKDPWTGASYGLLNGQFKGASPRVFSVDCTAPGSGDAVARLPLMIILDPIIGIGPEPLNRTLVMRGSQPDAGQIFNRVRMIIQELTSDLEIQGVRRFRLQENDQQALFDNWNQQFWKPQAKQVETRNAFSGDPLKAQAEIKAWLLPRAWKILKQRAGEQADAQAKENLTQEMDTQRYIEYLQLQRFVIRRNSLIEFKVDPGYTLMDVMADHVWYDSEAKKVVGDLKSARRAVIDAEDQLRRDAMSSVDKYLISANDDGLPGADTSANENIIDALDKGKDFVDVPAKVLSVMKGMQDLELGELDQRLLTGLANEFRSLAGWVRGKANLVGDSASYLAAALDNYKGFFRKCADLAGHGDTSAVKIADLPGQLGDLGRSFQGLSVGFRTGLDNFRKGLEAIPLKELSKQDAALVRGLKGSLRALEGIASASIEMSSGLINGITRMADGLMETGVKGSGRIIGKIRDLAADGATAAGDAGAGFIEKLAGKASDTGKSLGESIKKHGGKIEALGWGMDMYNVISEANSYEKSGVSKGEAWGRSLVTNGLEKALTWTPGSGPSTFNLIGLGNTIMTLGGAAVSKWKWAEDGIQNTLGMSAKQFNLSVPIKTGVNLAKSLMDDISKGSDRLARARDNAEALQELRALEKNYGQAASASKDKTSADAWLAKRKQCRDMIRKLGGRADW